MTIKAILFDKDGTLFHFNETWGESKPETRPGGFQNPMSLKCSLARYTRVIENFDEKRTRFLGR